MSLLKKIAAVLSSAFIIGATCINASAEVLPTGEYTLGNQWYFSDHKKFNYRGLLAYDEEGNPIGSTEGYIFEVDSPASIYVDGQTDYTVKVYKEGFIFPLSVKIGIRGDINQDFIHDVFDAVEIARFSVGTTELTDDFVAFCADANESGNVDVFDAVEIAKIVNEEEAERLRLEKEAKLAVLKQVVECVNVEREAAGLAPLTFDSSLTYVAEIRAKEIATLFSHTRPNGESCFSLLNSTSTPYTLAGENIAEGYDTPEAVVQAWMESPGHRENILRPEFTKIGIGHYTCVDEYGRTLHYWSQFFTANEAN